MKVYALTTKDNPYNYFKNPDEWEAYENLTGRRVFRALGVYSRSSSHLSVAEYNKEVERTIDAIIDEDPIGIYMKIETEVEDVY